MNTFELIALNIIAYLSLVVVFIALLWLLLLSIEGIVTAYDSVKDFLYCRKYGIRSNEEARKEE